VVERPSFGRRIGVGVRVGVVDFLSDLRSDGGIVDLSVAVSPQPDQVGDGCDDDCRDTVAVLIDRAEGVLGEGLQGDGLPVVVIDVGGRRDAALVELRGLRSGEWLEFEFVADAALEGAAVAPEFADREVTNNDGRVLVNKPPSTRRY
jgi:hypothetical protein